MECAHHRHWPLATEIQTRLDSEPNPPKSSKQVLPLLLLLLLVEEPSPEHQKLVTLGKGKAALESEGIGGIGISGVNCIDPTASAKAVSV